MAEIRVIEVKESVFANNDARAQLLREELKQNKTFLLNLMSSPGSGKTTTLMRTIERLKDRIRIGVMEADIDSSVDAHTISTTGVKAVQLLYHDFLGYRIHGPDGLSVTQNLKSVSGHMICVILHRYDSVAADARLRHIDRIYTLQCDAGIRERIIKFLKRTVLRKKHYRIKCQQ